MNALQPGPGNCLVQIQSYLKQTASQKLKAMPWLIVRNHSPVDKFLVTLQRNLPREVVSVS